MIQWAKKYKSIKLPVQNGKRNHVWIDREPGLEPPRRTFDQHSENGAVTKTEKLLFTFNF